MARPRLGRDVLARGAPERFVAATRPIYEATLYDLLKAYGDQSRRVEGGTLHIEAFEIHTVEDALRRLTSLLGSTPDWENLWQFLPESLMEGLIARSAIASTFAASLELAREGKVKLRQSGPFGPIYLKAAARDDGNISVATEPPDESTPPKTQSTQTSPWLISRRTRNMSGCWKRYCSLLRNL